ncbi:MAG: response regulator [Draconibacterium sp.]|nr:response regulator [Draconibacterium sp.]
MQNTKNPLIYIIEDSIVYKDLIVGYLQSKKYKKIKVFKTGEECLKDIEVKPDIIILDYSYEGINGLEFMRKVKQDYPEIDFIFLSGQSKIPVAIKVMKLGAADYIIKNEQAPFRLVRSIDQLLSATKKEKIRKGFNIGIVGFFIMLFVIIMTIIFVSIFFDLEL